MPGLGDLAGAVVAVYALHVARMLRAPAAIQLHMLGNIALDALVGTVPLIGDLFDFVFKAQTRNLALLERWLASPARDFAPQPARAAAGAAGHRPGVRRRSPSLGVWMLYLFFTG